MSDDDFDDIFSDTPEPVEPTKPLRAGRPRTRDFYPEVQAAKQAEEDRMRDFYKTPAGQRRIRTASNGRYELFNEKDFYQPVTVTFLSKVFGIHLDTVKNRLRNVTPVGHAGTSQNRPLYDFANAARYLIKPESKMDLRTYMRTLNPTDMPTNISKVFWEAERIRNKTLLETGEAWPTERVLGVMGQVFMMIKDRIPLIMEGMREEGLTDPQMEKLQAACDQFQRDLHEALVELPKQQQTPSRIAEVAVGIEDE